MARPIAMTFDVLPERTGGAAENMATDFMLLQRYPKEEAIRFRHYGWRSPAFTFGYSQKFAFVKSQLPEGSFDLCRRATGGGVVDHRDDWTFSLVIPRGHVMEEARATQSYRAVHEALAAALKALGVPAALEPAVPADASRPAGPAGICFERAEVFDVVHAVTGAKIAGGAQKRNKRGLLFQGSVWKPAAGAPALDWSLFCADFLERLGHALEAVPAPSPWPEFSDEEMEGLIEKYGSAEWMEFH